MGNEDNGLGKAFQAVTRLAGLCVFANVKENMARLGRRVESDASISKADGMMGPKLNETAPCRNNRGDFRTNVDPPGRAAGVLDGTWN